MDTNFCFQLLKNMMQNAFQTDTFYLKAASEEVFPIPSEIMRILQPNHHTTDMRFNPVKQKQTKCLYVTKTNLDFYIIYFFLSPVEQSDVIMIGPFRSDSISAEAFSKKIKEHPFLSAKHRSLLNYYENLPCVSLQNITNTISCIVNTYMIFEQPFEPVYIDFSSQINSFFDSVDTTEFMTNESMDDIDKTIRKLKNIILKGDVKSAQKELKAFLNETALLAEKEFAKCKRNLHLIHHTIFLFVYSTQTVYRLHVFNLFFEFIDKIEGISTYDEAVKMASDICYAYCMLFQKNTFPEYPKQINDVINYIHLHLQEKLTLSILSECFRISSTKLSASFKQSTGMTVTSYIQQARIQQAMNYLHNPSLPVSEIALSAGFHDFAYFSKVFKKHTGYSPTEYRERNSKACSEK